MTVAIRCRGQTAAIALRQRPSTPGVHSTFGTSTELLNYLRLMFSRLGCHVCPNGHVNAPTLNVAAELPITCSTCGVEFYGPSAEDLAFNSGGACPECDGLGIRKEVDPELVVPDPDLTLAEGAVAPAFRDIYLGANAVTPVHPGYDMITGLGSPNIANLVKDLLVARSVGR